MKNKRKTLIISVSCAAVLAAAALGTWFFWLKDYLAAANASPVYVNTISAIVGLDTGTSPRYSGVVEPQEVYKVNKDESKKVAEILVQPGDEVHVGDVLFRYDTQEMQLSLTQAEIDQQGIANMISTLQRQLTTAQAEKAKADKDEQAAYTIQISELEVQIRQQQYESSKKKEEIDRLRAAMTNTDVLSEVDGTVKEVNSGDSQQNYTGSPAAFISILSAGEFRVKGKISELNYNSLSVGQAVTVHSRLNTEQFWKGTVDSIDREAASDQKDQYFSGMAGEQSSSYYFYVVLETLDGLILGQHVYIEPDLGENARKDGLWLPSMYIAHDENGSFVWAKNDRDVLEKRMVTLGEYDSENDSYEITSGVVATDAVAYPSENLLPGMPTTTDASAQDFGTSPGYDDSWSDSVVTSTPSGDHFAVPEETPVEDSVYGQDGESFDDAANFPDADASGGEGYTE